MSPKLPPKQGYVEITDLEGNSVYQPTPEQVEKEAQTEQIRKLTTQLAQSDEAAIAAFEAQAATDDAIIALYEKIGG